MPADPTPNEVQAALIADLEAKLELANEREFYLMAENARMRAELGEAGLKNLFAATITGSNERKGSEMPAEGKGERQSAGTASGGSAQAPTFSNQKQGTPAGYLPNIPGQERRGQ